MPNPINRKGLYFFGSRLMSYLIYKLDFTIILQKSILHKIWLLSVQNGLETKKKSKLLEIF
jgi:hypothetical protein